MDEDPKKEEKEEEVDSENLNPEEIAENAADFDFSRESNKSKEEKTDFGLVKPRVLEQEMQESYLDYAMSVIIARALPDVRDGLKPVHRRVLYAMWETGLRSGTKYRKCAAVVGEVLKSYHPHGDIAVYDTLVRMAQDFNMRYPLVDGQGNFGSMDGDSPAAMRYTESRMSSISEELLNDIEKETIDFVPNYDGTKDEPKVLPAKLPNLLLNGSMGIAVGMATNIPPHNLAELCQATEYLIDHPDCNIDELMQFIKGPDFPTGAEIYGTEQIKAAYASGKGTIVMRAVANIEETKRGFKIVVSEIPYQVNKADLITKIADLIKLKKIEGITDLRDESDRTDKVRIVIELRSNAYPKKVLNRLYELTPMQSSFYTNMLALVDGIQPRVLTIKNILEEYVKHRKIVVRRRTEFELKQAKARAHILEGLRIALASIDEVVATIRKSKNRDEAHASLVKKFKLTKIQADAILDMRLSALAALERQKIEDEYQEKIKLIKKLEEILGSEIKISDIVKSELKSLSEKYPSERRTKIYEQSLGKFSAEDLIPSEQVIILLTRGNYIKRMPVSAYRSQVRGGKGVVGMETKEEDMIEHLVIANTHDDIYFFTDRGRVFHTKVYELPSVSRLSKGQAIVNILQISPEEKVTAMITIAQKDSQSCKYFLFATSKGMVKKTDFSMYSKVRQTGILAMKLRPEEKLRWVKITSGSDFVFQVSARGQAILYDENDIRPMGRTAAGIRGINLRANDYCVSTDVISPKDIEKTDALIVLEKGFGKRTPLSMFKPQLRGGMGIRAANVTDRTGSLVGMKLTSGDDYDIILASSKGQMIRMPLGSIKKLQRDTQGVILFRLGQGDKVTSVTVMGKDKSDKLDEEPENVEPEDLEIENVTPPEIEEESQDKTENDKTKPEGKPAEITDKKIEKSSKNDKIKKDKKEILSEKKEANIVEEKNLDEKTGLPEWAKAHSDEVKVKPQKIQSNLFGPEIKKKPNEPNYWGKNLDS